MLSLYQLVTLDRCFADQYKLAVLLSTYLGRLPQTSPFSFITELQEPPPRSLAGIGFGKGLEMQKEGEASSFRILYLDRSDNQLSLQAKVPKQLDLIDP
jgi:hypothetical protein